MDTKTKLEKIEEVITSNDFLKNQSVTVGVGYYIFDYPASSEIVVRNHIKNLIEKRNSKTEKETIKCIDVYDVMIDHLIEEELLEDSIEMEKEDGIDYLTESLSGLLELEKINNYFVDYIMNNIGDEEVLFIVGIGKIFPFVSASKIFNSLYQLFDKIPVVVFYPGKYDRQTLKLFDEFIDDNHYRAMPLVKEI